MSEYDEGYQDALSKMSDKTETMQAEIDELVDMLELYVSGGSDLITKEEKEDAESLIAKHKQEKE